MVAPTEALHLRNAAGRICPRFRSLSVQLQTLDAILEASERYSQPELKDWIDYGAHFCCAANECLDMPNRKKAARQLALVVLEATKSGCLPYLLRDRGGKLLKKLGKRSAANTKPAGGLQQSPIQYKCQIRSTNRGDGHLRRDDAFKPAIKRRMQAVVLQRSHFNCQTAPCRRRQPSCQPRVLTINAPD